jgi:hypothetical protein
MHKPGQGPDPLGAQGVGHDLTYILKGERLQDDLLHRRPALSHRR